MFRTRDRDRLLRPKVNILFQANFSCLAFQSDGSSGIYVLIFQNLLSFSRQNTQHSAKMQAKTGEQPLQGSYDASKSQDVVLHFGIIDILQEYDFSKRLEHAYKSLYFDPLSISAVDPTSYAKRFQQLMHQVFIETT